MEHYQGVILVRLQNVGSKSQGRYAFLVRDDDMSVLKLCRDGVPPADDEFFDAFDRREVVVEGRVAHGWLIAQSVEEIPEKQRPTEEPVNDETEK